MGDFERDFNPDSILQLSAESDDDDEFMRRPRVNGGVMWPGLQEGFEYTVVDRLDGFFLCADTPYIAKFCGSVMLRRFPTVFHKHLIRYKGLSSFLGRNTKHIYEFELFSLNNLQFRALVTTKEIVHKDAEPRFFRMVKSYHQAIRTAILLLDADSPTKKNALSNFDKAIVIYDTDWQPLSLILLNQLQALATSEDHRSNFPSNPEFKWCIFQLGQNRIREASEPLRCDEFAEIDSCVRLTGNFAAAVQCAKDYHAANNILWWIPHKLRSNWRGPPESKMYTPGLVPGLGNVTFKTENDQQMAPVSYTQFYTRIYSHVHKDPTSIFQKPYITKSLGTKFSNFSKGLKQPKENNKDRLLKHKRISEFINTIPELHGNSTEARVEIVLTLKGGQYETATQMIQQGFSHAAEFFVKHYTFDRSHIHAMESTTYKQRVSYWCPIFAKTLDVLTDKVYGAQAYPNAYLLPIRLMPDPTEFQTVLAIESILNFMLFGTIGRGFPELLLQRLNVGPFNLIAPTSLQLDFWPFELLIRDETTGTASLNLDQDTLQALRNQIQLSIDERCRRFIAGRKDFVSANGNDQERIEIATLIADMIFELIKRSHIMLTWVTIDSNISLQMMYSETCHHYRTAVFLSPAEFLNHLSLQGRAGHDKRHQPLFEILDHFRRPTTDTADDSMENLPDTCTTPLGPKLYHLLVPIIEREMQNSKYPLRFTINDHVEYVVLSTNNPTISAEATTMIIFKRAITLGYRARSNRHRLSPSLMVDVFIDWVRANSRSQYDLAAVATAMRGLIFENRIPSGLIGVGFPVSLARQFNRATYQPEIPNNVQTHRVQAKRPSKFPIPASSVTSSLDSVPLSRRMLPNIQQEQSISRHHTSESENQIDTPNILSLSDGGSIESVRSLNDASFGDRWRMAPPFQVEQSSPRHHISVSDTQIYTPNISSVSDGGSIESFRFLDSINPPISPTRSDVWFADVNSDASESLIAMHALPTDFTRRRGSSNDCDSEIQNGHERISSMSCAGSVSESDLQQSNVSKSSYKRRRLDHEHNELSEESCTAISNRGSIASVLMDCLPANTFDHSVSQCLSLQEDTDRRSMDDQIRNTPENSIVSSIENAGSLHSSDILISGPTIPISEALEIQDPLLGDDVSILAVPHNYEKPQVQPVTITSLLYPSFNTPLSLTTSLNVDIYSTETVRGVSSNALLQNSIVAPAAEFLEWLNRFVFDGSLLENDDETDLFLHEIGF